MKPRRHSVRPRLETLEGREVPAGNLTVTFSGSTLTVLGDANDNDVTFHGDAGDKTHFTLTSSGTIDHQPPATGVKNITIKMLDGNDYVNFDNTVAIDLLGSLKIDGGNGTNFVETDDLRVEKSVSITNGTHAAGSVDYTYLVSLSVGGGLTIKNGDGDTATTIDRNAAGVSTIKGNVSVTNGTGVDYFYLNDANVGGSIKINNGHGAGGSAGSIRIYNNINSAFRSVIGGNLSVTYLDGDANGYEAIWDTEVLGNVTLNHGSGAFLTEFDGYFTSAPVLIHGNLSINGTGTNSVDVTAPGSGTLTGLIVGKKFTVTSGSGDDTLNLNKLQVAGDTKLLLGDGKNTVNIDDSLFAGKFTLTTGVGDDNFNVEMAAGSSSATEFKKAVVLSLGDGFDTGNVAHNHADSNQAVVVWSTFVVTGWDLWSWDQTQEFFPNGNKIDLN